jgi:hypothetical protein
MTRVLIGSALASVSLFVLAACSGNNSSSVLGSDSGSIDATAEGAPEPPADSSTVEGSSSTDSATTGDAADATTSDAATEDSASRDASGDGDASDESDSAAEHPDASWDADSATNQGDSAEDAGDSGWATAPDAPGDAPVGDDASDAAVADAPDASSEPDAADSESGVDSSDSAVGPMDSGSLFDASGIDAAALCTPFTFDAPQIPITYVDAAAPSPSTFTGGSIESGTYYLTSLSSYQGAFGNASSTAEILIVDADNHTMRNAYADTAPPATYSAFGYVAGTPTANAMFWVLLCPGSGATATVYYSFTGTGSGAQLTLSNLDSVAVLTRR